MLANSFLLGAIVFCSLKLPEKHADFKWVLIVFLASTLIFAVVLIGLLEILKFSIKWEVGPWIVAIACWLGELGIGMGLSRLTPINNDVKTECRIWDILLQAAITFGIFMFAYWLASISPSLGGAMVNAPFTIIVALVGTWLTLGEKAAVGACRPMTSGMLSASAFALLGAWLIPSYSLAFGVGVSWTAAILFITAPQLVLATQERKLTNKEDGYDKVHLEDDT